MFTIVSFFYLFFRSKKLRECPKGYERDVLRSLMTFRWKQTASFCMMVALFSGFGWKGHRCVLSAYINLCLMMDSWLICIYWLKLCLQLISMIVFSLCPFLMALGHAYCGTLAHHVRDSLRLMGYARVSFTLTLIKCPLYFPSFSRFKSGKKKTLKSNFESWSDIGNITKTNKHKDDCSISFER